MTSTGKTGTDMGEECIGLRKDLLGMEEDSLQTDCESIWVKIFFAGKQPLYVGSIYRPTDRDTKPLEELDKALKKLTTKNRLPNIILAGDFNTPDIDWKTNSIKRKPQYGMELNQLLLDTANDNMLTQVQHKPTREGNVLDLCFTTLPDQIKQVDTAPGISDHDVVNVEMDTAVKYSRKQPRTVYHYNKGDMNGVRKELEDFKESFLESEPMTRGVEDNWSQLKNAVFNAMDKFIPKKKLSSWQHVPWINSTIKRMIRKKKRAWNKAKKSELEKDWDKFREIRKAIKAKMRKSHEEYVKGILENSLKEKPKKFWSYISSLKKDANGIPTLKTDHGPATDSKMKATALNQQYQSVFTKEDTNHVPTKGTSQHPSMPCIEFNTDGIKKLLENLNPGKAPGPDQVPIRILREAAQQIAPVLQVIFTQSYVTGTLPQDWLTANTVAIYKKGNRSLPVNYRPVSLTCVTTKLMEHIIFHSIMDHLELHTLLQHYQHGFRKQHSTESQLAITVEEIARALDHHHQIDMLILDFSKAFDTVPHQRLLGKIDHYGIRDNTKNWIKTWQTARTQRVVVDGAASETIDVESGVPQGTVLGPLMFLLYINDIGEDKDEDAQDLQKDLQKLHKWAGKWQMLFNAKKCYSMRIHRKQKPIILNYTMGDEVLAAVSSQSYLGMEIHEKLSWKHHIKAVAAKANRTLGFIRRNLSLCSSAIKKQAYTTLVRSQLEYGAAIWDPYRQNLIDSLEKVQRRGIRFITGNHSREDSVTAMRLNIGLPTLQERRLESRLAMMYKILHHQIAIPLPDYISQKDRATRSQHHLRFTRLGTSSDSYKYSFFPRTMKDWDELPTNIIELPTLKQFKEAISCE
eukprot:XP_011665032.1 PREDICTED: RNA-directed DNA polymerase from mobile element jockey-like [Strongylocentrotus purpuratus]